MAKVAAGEAGSEKCRGGCGADVIRASKDTDRSTVYLVQVDGAVGTWALEQSLFGAVPTARRIGRGTRFKVHKCPNVVVHS